MTTRLIAALLLTAPAACSAGLPGVWYSDYPQVLTQPYLTGGQVVVEWSDLQTAPSTYDWAILDTAMASAGVQVFTVQVDGATKPAFLFKEVPYTPNWGNTQSNDPLGLLMYWHPTYISTYTGFLAALAAHLNTSPYRSNFLGVRMNFNAVGTEQIDVPAANQKASTWTVPPGVANGPDWTLAISQNYQATVIDSYVSGFGITSSSIPVFARVTVDPAILPRHATGQPAGFTYADYFQQGKLYLFFTGGAPEFPLYDDIASLYSMYSTYLLPGLTTGYCEPVSDAWGVTGDPNNPLPHSITPPQWNYWRLLADLALGVSDIALYGADLLVADSAIHYGHNVGADYQSEFTQAFRFAARYAGYHADPVNSPGAWVAFRQSVTDFPASASAYSELTDYTRFITLLNPQDTVGLDARKDGTTVPFIVNKTLAGEQSIGPYNSRFGAWARSIPPGHVAQLQLNSTFRATVNNLNGVTVNITYLDNIANASFTTTFGTQIVTTALHNSGAWQTAAIPVSSPFAPNPSGGDIAIQATGGSITFHMVEVAKASASTVNGASFQTAVAPGSLFSIFGQNLATSTASASGLPLPGQLAGAEVTFGGYSAPLLYVSPGQINAQVPYEATPCGPNAPACPSSSVIVTSNGVRQAMTATLNNSAPGIFAMATGQAIAQNQDESLNTPQSPAPAGTVITVYMTGLGDVSNPPTDGGPASTGTLSPAILPTTASLDGALVTVQFAGLSPGFVGLAQVSFQVPQSLRAGQHSLVIQVGSNASAPAMLSTD